jgi:hypothetical protein
LITFVRLKLKGILRFILSVLAFVMLLTGMILGFIAMV